MFGKAMDQIKKLTKIVGAQTCDRTDWNYSKIS